MATAALVSVVAASLLWPALGAAAPVNEGALTSGKAVNGVVSSAGGVAYTFTAVAGRHVTLAITSPHVEPSGDSLQMQVYDASGGTDASGVYINTGTTEIDFTPTAAQAGATTVVISAYNFETLGSFTLTYAKDVTGELTPGVPTAGALLYGGQHADYAFIAVAGQAAKLAVSNPHVEPSGDSLQMQVYDASGGTDANGAYIGTGPAEIAFTPTAAQAGATTVVISPYSFETLGSFTLTLTNGSLPSGAPGPAAPPRPEPAPRPRKIGPGIGLATALGLPAAKECYSRRAFAIHVRQPHGYARIVSAEVFLGGRHERTLNKKGLSREVVLHGLPRGKFTIRIVARTAGGRTLTATRTYRTCPS